MTPDSGSQIKSQVALMLASVLWASAFVGIRIGLHGYSPGPLALLRFLVASACMLLIYPALPVHRRRLSLTDRLSLLVVGVLGLGSYNIALNYGEIVVSSGVASFIVSLSPIITVLFAGLFLGERFNAGMIFGMLVSISGVGLISLSGNGPVYFDFGIVVILVATLISGLYSVVQKPFLSRFHAIEVTAWIIWGCTLLLLIYLPAMLAEWGHASLYETFCVVYLGIFPAAIGYVAWSYGLRTVPASRAAGYLYYMPIVASLLGWLLLDEIPTLLSLLGGLVVLAGVWIVSHQQRRVTLRDASPG